MELVYTADLKSVALFELAGSSPAFGTTYNMDFSWRHFRDDEWWRQIPAWKDVDYETFIDHKWQEKNVITNHRNLLHTISDLVSTDFLEDADFEIDYLEILSMEGPLSCVKH